MSFPSGPGAANRPPDSAGKRRPICDPKPKRRTYSYIFCGPTLNPIWMAPMLLDLSSTSCTAAFRSRGALRE